MHPNVLTGFIVNNPGIIGGVPDDHIFAKDAQSRPLGAVWVHDDLVQGSGCVMLVMDVNWWDVPNQVQPSPVSHTDLLNTTANFHDFLSYCGDHDRDGILDSVEKVLGTDPDNPDSDGDGLCDGKVAVDDPAIVQKCIAGEDAEAHQNTDGDSKIDALDDDDDNDGILTKTEVADVTAFGNPDSDNVPAWLDTDSDGDGVTDADEGRVHLQLDGRARLSGPELSHGDRCRLRCRWRWRRQRLRCWRRWRLRRDRRRWRLGRDRRRWRLRRDRRRWHPRGQQRRFERMRLHRGCFAGATEHRVRAGEPGRSRRPCVPPPSTQADGGLTSPTRVAGLHAGTVASDRAAGCRRLSQFDPPARARHRRTGSAFV